jgi:hypothetical protein
MFVRLLKRISTCLVSACKKENEKLHLTEKKFTRTKEHYFALSNCQINSYFKQKILSSNSLLLNDLPVPND